MVAQVVAHLPGLLGGLHQEQAALFLFSAGTFSTGDSGNAVIFASGSGSLGAIQDNTNTTGWQGVILQGNDGQVYGNITPTGDFTIPTGKPLTIEADQTLTIPAGVTLTNEGTISNSSTLDIYDQSGLTGSGEFTITCPAPDITDGENLSYNGTDQFSKLGLTLPTGSVEVLGKNFTISDSTTIEGWSLEPQEIIDAVTYTVTAKHTDGRTIEQKVTVSPAKISIDSATAQNKTYDGSTQDEVELVTFTGGAPILGTDYTATAQFDSADAGESKNVTVTVNLKEGGNYTFSSNSSETTATAPSKTIYLGEAIPAICPPSKPPSRAWWGRGFLYRGDPGL